ncbi:NfeD family protein [Candidatus Acetothermia bacterium]|nr:NfeD family protein [Candidatus Acetothermia bacterium]
MWCHLLLIGLPIALAATFVFLPAAQAWPIAAVLVGISAFLAVLMFKAMRRSVVTGREAMKGKLAEVRSWDGREGQINYRGELWSARGPQGLKPGEWVTMTDLEGLKVIVQRTQAQTLNTAKS